MTTDPTAGDILADDYVLPFSTDRSRVLGRLVRLGPLADDILKRHDYPTRASEVLGQALALTSMLGSTLKFDGNLIIQTSTDGPLGLLVVNFEAPGRLRGYASVDRDVIEALAGKELDDGRLLGSGHMALTIDPGGSMERYQGIVALEGSDLAVAANGYFRQSEQLPTFVKLVIARHHSGTSGGGAGW